MTYSTFSHRNRIPRNRISPIKIPNRFPKCSHRPSHTSQLPNPPRFQPQRFNSNLGITDRFEMIVFSEGRRNIPHSIAHTTHIVVR